jgi:isopentenyl-diphosphate delta-isomerase
MEFVVLVDDRDREQGLMEKLQAHKAGRLHRAVSVFIFNSKNELLLQQRAAGKYHSANLWTNTCCGHPREQETPREAASRRLYEEMGLTGRINEAFTFIYNAQLSNGLSEHEYDHVFIGHSDAVPRPDDSEVGAWKYISMTELDRLVKEKPEQFTEWFKICLQDHRDKF